MWVFLALLWYSFHSGETAGIKLGLLMPITPGDTETTYGKIWATTALVAAQTINNQSLIPGFNLEFAVLDTLDTSTGTVMAAFQCAVVEHCVGVVGAAYSQYSEIVQYVLQNYSIPQISPVSTASELSDKKHYPTFMRTIPADTAAGPAIAQVISHFGWKQVGLIVGSDTYSNSLYQSFYTAASRANIKLVVQTFLETVQPDYQARVAELKNAYTQVIVVFAQQLEAGEVMKEGYSQGILGEGFVWIGGDTLTALNIRNLVIAPAAAANTSLAQQYEQQMASLNLSAPYNSFVYDAVYTYAHAFRKMVLSNSSWEDPRDLLAALRETNFTGVTGDVQFDENGDRTKSAFDILNWMSDGQLNEVAMIDEQGQFLHFAPIIWSDNTPNIPADYLYLLRFPPPRHVEIIFETLAAVLLASVSLLIILIIFAFFFSKSFKAPPEQLALNIPNTVGGVLGCAAVILIVSGVSHRHCIIAPILMDLSLLICGGVLTFSTLHEFIVEYSENATERLISVVSAKVILYGLWGAIILLNAGALVGTFSYQQPNLELFHLEKNFYEDQCNFGQHAMIILPITIGVLFAFAVAANLMKMCVNADVAKNMKTPKIDIINSILHALTILVLVIGAVVIAVITPTQTQIDITMCSIIIVANLSVPCNLFAWWYVRHERISYRRDSNVLAKRVPTEIPASFKYDHDNPTNNPLIENNSINTEGGSITVQDLNS